MVTVQLMCAIVFFRICRFFHDMAHLISGKLKEGDKKYKGKFEIPNLSEENEPDEVDVNVTVDKSTDDSYKIKEVMRKVGTPQIQLQLAKYIKQLKEGTCTVLVKIKTHFSFFSMISCKISWGIPGGISPSFLQEIFVSP